MSLILLFFKSDLLFAFFDSQGGNGAKVDIALLKGILKIGKHKQLSALLFLSERRVYRMKTVDVF